MEPAAAIPETKNLQYTHPRKYGAGSRKCRVCGSHHGLIPKTISIPIIDNSRDEETLQTFKVLLTNPTGGAMLSALKTCTITICHDDQFTGMLDKMSSLMQVKQSKFSVGTATWSEQFVDAMNIEGGVGEDGEISDLAFMDFLMALAALFAALDVSHDERPADAYFPPYGMETY